MRYQALTPDKALILLDALRKGEDDQSSKAETRGEGPALDLKRIEKLERQLSKLKGRYPKVLGQRDPAGGEFEAEGCPLVHELLPFDAQMLADYDFWTWLAVTQCREIVEWRHGGKAGSAAVANFGIGQRRENLLFRMWLRADAGHDPERDDPYELAKLGDQDFWRSHVLRIEYGRSRPLVQALVTYQFGGKSEGRLKTLEIRALAKRLTTLHPSRQFEYMDEKGAMSLVEREAKTAKATAGRNKK